MCLFRESLVTCKAEAAYGILAANPLFFQHMKEEEAAIRKSWKLSPLLTIMFSNVQAPAGLVTQAQQALHHYLAGQDVVHLPK